MADRITIEIEDLDGRSPGGARICYMCRGSDVESGSETPSPARICGVLPCAPGQISDLD